MKNKKSFRLLLHLLIGIIGILSIECCHIKVQDSNPPDEPCNLPPPDSAYAIPLDSFTANIVWTPVPGAQSYKVIVKEGGGGAVVLDTLVSGSLDSILVHGLKANVNYLVYITPGCSASGNLGLKSSKFSFVIPWGIVVGDMVVMRDNQGAKSGLDPCSCNPQFWLPINNGEEQWLTWSGDQLDRKLIMFNYTNGASQAVFKVSVNKGFCDNVYFRPCSNDNIEFTIANNTLQFNGGAGPNSIQFGGNNLENIAAKRMLFDISGGTLRYSFCSNIAAGCDD